jgi:acetyltransferase-like isoleucine patch superfamily enzyme
MECVFPGMSVSKELKEFCEVGKYSYTDGGSPNVVINKDGYSKLIIGSFVSIGPHCDIYLGSEHKTEFVSTFPFSRIFHGSPQVQCAKSKGNIVIGSDVWIGSHVIILSGVNIGHGAVIGAGSVVAKDVQPYSIVVGNPIREIRKRFSQDVIEKLLTIQWWNYTDEKIEELMPLLMSDNIERFIGYVEERKWI